MASTISRKEKNRLKKAVRNVVVGQGNRYIKELLRDNDLPIGTTKTDFMNNLMTAIDEEKLTGEMIDAWLAEIEGWGNQHIYLFERLSVKPKAIKALIKASPYAGLLNKPASHEFPLKLKLTSIALTNQSVSLTWHRGSDRWIHVPSKDYQQPEDGDLYEYRAFRQRSNRTVVRFEWQFDKPYCAILLQLPHEGSVHQDCMKEVWDVIAATGLAKVAPAAVRLSDSVNAFSEDDKKITASGRTMRTDGGHVDFVSTVPDRGIAQIAALRTVSSAIDTKKFQSADGKFRLSTEKHTALSRAVNIDIYGSQSRIRITVQCRREDVYYMTNLIWDKNQAS
jgi:hypothetical protein